MYIFSLIILNT